MDNIDYFVTNGVYVFKGDYNSLFVCCPTSNLIGKLTKYEKNTNSMYEKTCISYFLNCYNENDIKSLFLNRKNYEMVGKIGNNFEFSKDNEYLLKKEKL